MKYLLQCRVPAKAIELHGVWFVSEADTVTLKDHR